MIYKYRIIIYKSKMGIYIIKSLHSEWIKVGHHLISDKRPSVYYRYINRGFYSCKCPEEIKDKVGFKDLELLYWFYNLNEDDEKNLHLELKKSYESEGEWYKYENLEKIVNILHTKYNGLSKLPDNEEYSRAIQWSNKFNKVKRILYTK
jgi:hypothetical protein